MCLIAYSPQGKLLERRVFDAARRHNQDGIGVMSCAGTEKFLGRKSGKKAWRYLESLEGLPFAVHFRYATHGAVSRALCHPFAAPLSSALVMHNGVITCTAKYAWAENESDTSIFVRRFMEAAPNTADPEHKQFYKRIENIVGRANVLLVYHRDTDKWTIVNEDQGTWIDGFWYSNEYSLPMDMQSWDWTDYRDSQWWRRFKDEFCDGKPYGDKALTVEHGTPAIAANGETFMEGTK